MDRNDGISPLFVAFVALFVSMLTLIGSCNVQRSDSPLQAEATVAATPTPLDVLKGHPVLVTDPENPERSVNCMWVDTPRGQDDSFVDCTTPTPSVPVPLATETGKSE